jgi:hypothetical protein
MQQAVTERFAIAMEAPGRFAPDELVARRAFE